MQKWQSTFIAAAGIAATAICAPASAQEQYSLAVGTQGGTMDRLGAGLVEVFNQHQDDARISTVPGGGAANPARVGGADADLGFSFSNFAVSAYNGRGNFDQEYKNLRHVAAFWGSCYHQYVAQEVYDGGIRSWDDIVASEEPLAIGAGSPGTSTDAINRLLLDAYDTSFEDLEDRGFKFTYAGMSQISQQMRAGQIDIYFHNSGDPNAAGVEASVGRDLTFMELSDKARETLVNAGFSACTIPGGIYDNVDEDHASMGALGVLLAKEDVDPELIYQFLKITHENIDYLGGVQKIFASWTPEYGAADYGVPLHEGAERFYREVGVLN